MTVLKWSTDRTAALVSVTDGLELRLALLYVKYQVSQKGSMISEQLFSNDAMYPDYRSDQLVNRAAQHALHLSPHLVLSAVLRPLHKSRRLVPVVQCINHSAFIFHQFSLELTALSKYSKYTRGSLYHTGPVSESKGHRIADPSNSNVYAQTHRADVHF